MNEQLDELTVGHDEFGDQIDVPVSAAAVRLVRVGRPKFFKELVERRERRRLATVVFVPVHVQDFLAGNGKHAGEDALGEARAQHDAVVLGVHDATLEY